MSLLQRVVDDAVDPGYAYAADHPRPGTSRLGRSVVLAATLVLLSALVAATFVQVRQRAPEAASARLQLLQAVRTATAATDDLAGVVQQRRVEVAKLQQRDLDASAAGRQLQTRLDMASDAAGLRAATGPGVTLTLTDGPPTQGQPGEPDLARVLDRDLQQAVNGLFAAGAEAVSVNGRRITATSAIRAAGEAILVGYRPLSPPYVVTALGDPASLADRFAASADGRDLATVAQTYGIGLDVETSGSLTVPAAEQTTLRYARPAGRAGAAEEQP